jgi:general secretion pathway protein C
MSARWWTLVVWALAAACALYWGLLLATRSPAVPPQAQVAAPGAGLRGDLGRLLGVDAPVPVATAAPAPAADARFELVGVVSPRSPQAGREGVALIAVDGKPAKAYRVGAAVDGDQVLKSVSARGATLGPRGGTAAITLDIAPPAPAATGTLPKAQSGAAGTVRPPTMPGMPPGAYRPPTQTGGEMRPPTRPPTHSGGTHMGTAPPGVTDSGDDAALK